MCMLWYFIISFLLLSCPSCNFVEENNDEIRKLIEHYSTVDVDKEKLAAVNFLLDNMQWHFTFSEQVANDYYTRLNGLLCKDSFPEHINLDVLWQSAVGGNNILVSDISCIKADDEI